MEILVILGVLLAILAVGWFVLKLIIIYTVACLVYLGICSIKDQIDG